MWSIHEFDFGLVTVFINKNYPNSLYIEVLEDKGLIPADCRKLTLC